MRAINKLTALLLAAALLLSACGPKAAAATMHLMKTEGTVGVVDGEGKDIKPKENLGLYDGYGVDTREESYAWINLDEVKLTKLDQDSEIEIRKEDKRLEIEVKSGSLFFHVTEPLEDDETMTIRTSSMMVGIRGTCGWVETSDEKHLSVYVLEGTVECTVEGPDGKITTASISGGETALMSAEQDEDAIALGSFREAGVPDFVRDELEEDEDLCGLIEEASGLDILNWNPVAELAAGLERIGYYGDPAACRMTLEERAAYARILREEMARSEATVAGGQYGWETVAGARCLAGLVDLGNGMPALMYGCGAEVVSEYGNYLMWPWSSEECTVWAMWQFVDGQPVKLDNLGRTEVYADHLYVGGRYAADPGLEASVYPFENGRIAASPSTTAMDQSEWYWEEERPEERTIDGRMATAEQLDAWEAQWSPGGSLAGFSHGSDVGVDFWGLAPAQDVIDVLEGNASPAQEGENTPDRTVSAYDPSTRIRRTTLDTEGDPIEIYFEVPVFAEEGEGYGRINAFFQNRQDQFFAEGFAEERRMAREENYYNETFYNCWSARVAAQTERLVSVELFQDYHMGGPHPWTGLETYAFRTDTGEALLLSDVADGAPEEIRAAILSAARLQDPDNNFIDFDSLQGRDIDEFRFYVSDGKLIVTFNEYECTQFRAFIEDIELPMGLKAELR